MAAQENHLKIYSYEVNGVEHTAQLDEETAEKYGAKLVKEAKAPARTKAQSAPENKAAE